jgi:hypothetical protein
LDSAFGASIILEGLFERRQKIFLDKIRSKLVVFGKEVILLADCFESKRHRFWQESSFYYLMGIEEPATVFCIFLMKHPIVKFCMFQILGACEENGLT